MANFDELKAILADVLQLGDQVDQYDESTPLLGSIPEFDSMAVVTLITALEDNFGIMVNDDEISADTFATVGSVHQFVTEKLAA